MLGEALTLGLSLGEALGTELGTPLKLGVVPVTKIGVLPVLWVSLTMILVLGAGSASVTGSFCTNASDKTDSWQVFNRGRLGSVMTQLSLQQCASL
jgi:hypothetical protein